MRAGCIILHERLLNSLFYLLIYQYIRTASELIIYCIISIIIIIAIFYPSLIHVFFRVLEVEKLYGSADIFV